ncbi:hypothetical protein T492DRAFT_833749 [Pavlovales sp. CCMP2436]|nr:hypothetical protein T492DRAFT_833749 [Pavlovales sp. CCMP2436]
MALALPPAQWQVYLSCPRRTSVRTVASGRTPAKSRAVTSKGSCCPGSRLSRGWLGGAEPGANERVRQLDGALLWAGGVVGRCLGGEACVARDDREVEAGWPGNRARRQESAQFSRARRAFSCVAQNQRLHAHVPATRGPSSVCRTGPTRRTVPVCPEGGGLEAGQGRFKPEHSTVLYIAITSALEYTALEGYAVNIPPAPRQHLPS